MGYKQSGIIGAFFANLGFIIPAILFMYVSYKFVNKIKNNKKAKEVITAVRSSALAVMIVCSITLFKSAFLTNTLDTNEINTKNIILAIGIMVAYKVKKINSILLIAISACVAIILKI